MQAHDILNGVRVFHLQHASHRKGHGGQVFGDVAGRPFVRDPKNTLRFVVEFIVAQLILHVDQHHQAGRHADSQSQDIDDSVAFIFNKISECDFEIVFKHTALHRSAVSQ